MADCCNLLIYSTPEGLALVGIVQPILYEVYEQDTSKMDVERV